MTRRLDFPLIQDFVRGYLHQDVVQEHGNAKAAAQAFVGALLPDERADLEHEAKRLSEKFRTLNIEEANRQLSNMGSAWIFSSVSEIQDVLRTLEGTE